MKHSGFLTLLISLIVVLATGCGGSSAPASPTPATYAPVIDPANFVTTVDNPFFPLTPGTTYIYEGTTPEGTERTETQVTSETKQILGVTCVVIWDRVSLNGELIEETYDWYAQDKSGNVWYFGEDTKEYEEGKVVSTQGAWEAGVDGAQPGIIMKANPLVGDSYRQEYYQGEAEDMAEVLSLSESATVPQGAYTDLLMTKEWTPLSPGGVEHKYYARGLGLILEAPVSGGGGKTELIEIRTEK